MVLPSDLQSEDEDEDETDERSGNIVSRMLIATAAADQSIKTWYARDGKLADTIKIEKG